MRINFGIFSVLCTGALTVATHAAPIAQNTTSIQPISQYGLIQNVQNYSSNPFWNPNGLYNQRMPQAVYVQGADLNTADCQRTVGTLIASYCVENDNCVGMRISDIRPAMMLQLARLPGHNYATSCAGFIDSEFESYVSKYSNAGPSNAYTAFPTGTVTNPTFNETEYQIDNPYIYRTRKWNNQEWEQEKFDRYDELMDLQSQNSANDVMLARADFPTTAADLSFTDRMELQSAGYEPFKDSSPYAAPLKIEDEQEYESRRLQRKSAFCSQQYATQLAILDADLKTLTQCRQKGTPFAQCTGIKGRY